jgi:RHS repeat-associated protein
VAQPVESPLPVDPATGLEVGASEIVSARTEYSQTFANPNGTRTTQFFTNPVFYRPAGSSSLVPITVGFKPLGTDGSAFTSAQAPVAVEVSDTSTAGNFLTTTYGSLSIGFRLPGDLAGLGVSVKPTVAGPVADYAKILPGVDLRVIANAHGAKSFFVWPSLPDDPTLRYVVDAPGLSLKPQEDGSIAFVDAKSDVVARIPKPYAVDSTADPLSGGGHYTDAVSLSLAADGKTVTVSVDPNWLKTAVYPVYVDPTTGWIYNAGSSAYGDAFVDSYVPTTNFGDYQRPDSPYYHELWNGVDPGGGGGTMYDFLRWDLSAYAGWTVDAATLRLFPYYQYYGAPTTETTYLRRLTSTWTEGGVTWNTKPTYTTTNGTSAACVQGTLCSWNVTAIAQQWLQAVGPTPNNGFQLDTIGLGTTYWKRFIASEQGGINVPALNITYYLPTATPTTKLAFTGDRTFSWAYADWDGYPESKYQVQISSDGGATWPAALDSGQLSGSATTWTAPTSMVLSDLTAYTWHVRVYNGTSWSVYSATSAFTYDAYERGGDSFYTRVPFDLGGGWNLGIGVHNGEGSLSRSVFSIPTVGPAGDLALAYNSTNVATAGPFGYGWSSTLTQGLWLNNPATPSLIIWKRADGGRVAFTGSGTTWSAVSGHFETLSYTGSPTYEYTVTEKDQTKLVFESTGSYRLKRIVDRFSKALTLTYSTGSIVATDATGRATTIALDASGHVDTVTDVAGRVFDFTVGTSTADLTSIAEPDPDGAGPLAAPLTAITYASHLLNNVTRHRRTAAGGDDLIVWAIAYTSGKVTSVIDPIAHASYGDVPDTFAYNAGSTVAGLLKTYSPVTRNTTTYSFDPLGRVTAVLDPNGFTTTSAYDANSNLTQIVRPISLGPPVVGRTTTFSYDARGNVLTETADLTSSSVVVTAYSYSATNDLLTRSEADNDSSVKLVTKYAYDVAGHLTSTDVNCTTSGTTPPSPASSCTGAGTQDASTNLVTTDTYTANDQLLDETDPLGRVTRHVYDANGNETSVTQNYVSGQSATAERNVVTSRAYDAATTAGRAGLATSATDAVGTVTTYTFDALARQLTEALPGDPSIPTLTRTTTYDEFGNELTQIEAWTGVTRTTTTVYDKANRPAAVTDPAGVATTTTFDAAGDAIGSATSGVITTRTFDGLGRVSDETVAGAVTTHSYDGMGNELVTRDPALVTSSRTFDLAGRLLTESVSDGGSQLTTTDTYDPLGRILSTTDPLGTVTASAYDRAGRTSTTTVAGALSTDVYDRVGNLLSTKSPTGEVTATVVDALNRTTMSIANCTNSGAIPPGAGIVCTGTGTHDSSTNLTTITYYDASGNSTGSKDPNLIITKQVINVRNLVSEIIEDCTGGIGNDPVVDPSSCAASGIRDGATNVDTTISYDGAGSEISRLVTVNQTGSISKATAYDGAGNILAEKDGMGTITRRLYDSSGRMSSLIVNCTNTGTTVPTSGWESCAGTGTHDGTWNLTTVLTYDSHGNVVTKTTPNGRVTQQAYDAANRLIQQTENYTAGTPAADQNLSTYFAYDAAGNQIAVRTPTTDRSTFTVTAYRYDGAGRVLTMTINCTVSGTTPPGDPAWKTCNDQSGGTANAQTNLVTTYTYDARGNRTSIKAPDPSATASGTGTTYTDSAYDTANRLCRLLENATSASTLQSLTDPCSDAVSGGTATANISTRYTYDGAGRQATMSDGRGNTTTYGYDATGNMISETDALGRSASWGYDALGRRSSQANRDGTAVAWTYDEGGRIALRTATGTASVQYTYDANGNRLTANDGTRSITTSFDRLNRPLTVSVSDDPGAGTTYSYGLATAGWTDPTGTYTATLDAFGREVSLTDPIHGAAWGTAYRADGQRQTLAEPDGNTSTWAFDTAGRPTGSATTAGQTTRASYVYTLNRAGQRLSESSTITGDPTNGTVNFTYDPLGRITGYSGTPVVSQAFAWDKVPNRTSQQIGAGSPVTMTYDPANRPTSDSSGGLYSSDLDGRLTTRPGQTLVWDALGRLVQVKDPFNTNVATYTYDPLDRLLTVSRSTGLTKFRYVGVTTAIAQARDLLNTVLYNVGTNTSGEALFDFGPGGSNQRFYGTNGHHDLTWTADASGAVTATLRSDPFGTPGTATGGPLPEFRFQGSWYDTSSALTWATSRWYAPSLGRFISEDTLLGQTDQPETRHLYAYGAGDPLDKWDPTGHDNWYLDPVWTYVRHFWRLMRSAGAIMDVTTGFVCLGVSLAAAALVPVGAAAIATSCTTAVALVTIGGIIVGGFPVERYDVYKSTYPGYAVKVVRRSGIEWDHLYPKPPTYQWNPIPHGIVEWRFDPSRYSTWHTCWSDPTNGVHKGFSGIIDGGACTGIYLFGWSLSGATSIQVEVWQRPWNIYNPWFSYYNIGHWPSYRL